MLAKWTNTLIGVVVIATLLDPVTITELMDERSNIDVRFSDDLFFRITLVS